MVAQRKTANSNTKKPRNQTETEESKCLKTEPIAAVAVPVQAGSHKLERRGHSFVRYADDMVIFCESKASARQTLEHIVPFIEKKLF